MAPRLDPASQDLITFERAGSKPKIRPGPLQVFLSSSETFATSRKSRSADIS